MKDMNARQIARVVGEKYYVTGLPCKNGHTSKRATLTGTCCQCTAEASAAWRKTHLKEMAAHQQRYRDNNRAKVRELDRVAKAVYRKENPEEVKTLRDARYRRNVFEQTGRVVRDNNVTHLSEVLERLRQAHGDSLEYVEGFTKLQEKATFRCRVHDKVFVVNVHNTTRGANPCPQCNHRKSQQQEYITRLMGVFTTTERDTKGLALGKQEIDIYLPEHNLAIEYHGMYYHSHWSAEDEKENKHKTIDKYRTCQDRGVRLITIFESEWLERRKQIIRLLRNAIGKSKGKLMARKCDLQKVDRKTASAFYEKYHPQGGEGNGEHYGLFWKGKLVACMRFAFGNNDRGANTNRVWTLARYATRVNVIGAASRLFKAFLQDKQPTEVKSFSDNRYFSGKMYEQLGFVQTNTGKEKADYQVWSTKLGLLPKTHYQRRCIPKRLADHKCDEHFDPTVDGRTEADMTYLMGAARIYDCGKKRWVYTLDTPPISPA